MASFIASAFRSSLCAAFLISAPPAWTQTSADSRIQALERQLAEQKRSLRDWGGLLRYGSDNTELPQPAAGEDRVVFFGDQITEFWGRGKAPFFPSKRWLN